MTCCDAPPDDGGLVCLRGCVAVEMRGSGGLSGTGWALGDTLTQVSQVPGWIV